MNQDAFLSAVGACASANAPYDALRATLDEEFDAIARTSDPSRRAAGYAAFVAEYRNNLQSLLAGGVANLHGEQLQLVYRCAQHFVSVQRRFHYRQRLRVRRRPYSDASCGAYPFRDLEHETVHVLSADAESRPSESGRRHAYAAVDPFTSRGLRKRTRAALYLSRLEPRRLTAADLKTPDEHALIGQWGVFAKQEIPAGTCLGVYGGVIMDAAETAAVTDDRYLLIASGDNGGSFINGENLLSLSNSLFVLDEAGKPVGNPASGYNAEMARFAARMAYGRTIALPALFATADIAPGDEVRWNYGLASVPMA